MASGISGSMSVNSAQYIVAMISYSETYDVATNTSAVTANLYYRRTNSYAGATYSPGTFYVKINGTNYAVYTGTFTIPGNDNNWKHVGGKTVTGIGHNADGSKTISIGGSHSSTASGSYMNFTMSDNVALTTIPRASKPTVSTDPLTIGNAQTITTNRASTSFTHTVKVAVGDYTETINSVGASTTWTPTAAALMQYMSSWEMTATVTVTTYNGTTQIGSAQSTTFKLRVDTSVYKPVITFGTPSDTNSTTAALETAGSFIKGYSNLQVQATAVPNDSTYGDTVASLKVELGNVSQTSAAGGLSVSVNFMANGITAATVKATATDSRGFTVTKTLTLTLINYAPLSITTIRTERVNQGGVHSETGEYISYEIECTAFIGSFGQANNSITVRSKSKAAAASTYDPVVTEKTVTTSGSGAVNTAYTITGVTVGTYDPSGQFDIVFGLVDALSSTTFAAVRVHEGIPVFSWGADHFDVYGELHIHDREDVMQYSTLTPTGFPWKLAGTASGTTAVNFDSTLCSEIMLVASYVENANYTWVATSIIPTGVLDQHGFFVMMGARISLASAQDKGCLVQITDTYARINEWVSNRASVASSGSLSVYYR